jgi:hypothetical protein
MRQRVKPYIFSAVVILSFLFPRDSLLHTLEQVTLVTYVMRGIMKDYDEFSSTMDGGKRR